MLKNKVVKVLKRYVERYPFAGEDKEDRWVAAARFLTFWDLSQDDFGAMYEKAIGDLSVNFINHKNSYSTEGIAELSSLDEETKRKIRKEFKKLSVYEEDLDERQKQMDNFRDNINEMLKHAGLNTNRLKQDTHAGMAYLFMLQPQENYMFCSSEAALFASYTGFKGRIGNGKSFKMKEYYRMCGEVARVLGEEKELMEEIRRKVENKLREEEIDFRILEEKDPDWHILIYDLILRAGEDKLYYTEDIQPPVKSYTEDLIQKIRQQEDQDDLVQELKEVERQLDGLDGEEEELECPELAGKGISVKKKIGSSRIKGQIISCDGKSVLVQLPDRTAKYAVSAMVSGILILEDESLVEPYRKQQSICRKRERLEKERLKKQEILKELEAQGK